jgi:predicted outer membrane protein
MRTFITVALSSLALTLASAATVRADEKQKANADTSFLTKVIPGTAASVKIIEHAAKNASDEEVRHFAKHVAKQHKEFVKTASEHAKRLKAENAIDSGNEHLNGARAILATIKK